MKKVFQLVAVAAVGALVFGCTGIGDDDDDDDNGFLLSGGTYTVSNHSVTQDECDFAGVPATLNIGVPGANGSDAEIDPPNGIELERIGNNLTGFDELQDFDLNPNFDCVADETYNYDGTLTGDDLITFTVTTFWERDTSFGGTDAECASGYGVAFFPCETIESFDLNL